MGRADPNKNASTCGIRRDEAALLLGMELTGQWNWSYLPLHLCSINVFVCLYNTLTDRNWCKEELYALCIPGAMLALLLTGQLHPQQEGSFVQHK